MSYVTSLSFIYPDLIPPETAILRAFLFESTITT